MLTVQDFMDHSFSGVELGGQPRQRALERARMKDGDKEIASRVPLFAGLASDVTDRLLSKASVKRFPPGSVLFNQGEVGKVVHVLLSGIVELSRVDGPRECGVLLANGGDVFVPVAALFQEPYLTSARVLTSARLLLLDAGVLHEEALRTPDLAMRMIQLIGGQWRMAVRHILDLKCRSAPQRLAAFLLRLVDEGPFSESGELPVPKRHLAARVGMTAETLSRTLQLLAENGLHVRGSRIIVRDRARIDAFCGPDPYPDRDEAKLGVHAF
ncbi:cyclic nucleotide-binding domain-containing protein [Sphingomonas parva]|uniref:Cyclic nucleotide-binding domain-containing protein n=1 Tax=Sphingomonas parva TaxID=2555898 RepID=A0A4Y8ZSV5_9SPHN|nr:helix-turn-helix domain-containing protein [Sphingomonas parva]TFI57536.1 cyclic nucleotide-binding domain-containing protein [Sphingomonas parva]